MGYLFSKTKYNDRKNGRNESLALLQAVFTLANSNGYLANFVTSCL